MKTTRTIATVVSALMIAAAAATAGEPVEQSAKASVSASLKVAKGLNAIAIKKAEQAAPMLIVTVLDAKGNRMDGLLVEIDSNLGLVPHDEKYTDAKGMAGFKGLKPDLYRIVVHSESGFEWQMVEIKAGIVQVAIKIGE